MNQKLKKIVSALPSKHEKLISSGRKRWSSFFAGAQPLVEHMHAEGRKMFDALAVFVLDPKIRAWLEENDPKALEQALAALGQVKS